MRGIRAKLGGLLWLSLFAQGVLAQSHISLDGKFEVDEISGCAPFDIAVTIRLPYTCTSGCDVDLDGSGTEYEYKSTNQSGTFTYTSAGTYWLKVLIGTTDTDSIQVTVLENRKPDFHVYTCGNNEVAVAIKDSGYDEYIVNYNDGTPEITLASMGTDQHLYAAATPQTISVRGHNLNAADQCDAANVVVTPRTTLPSPSITRLEVLDDSRVALEYDAEDHILYRLAIAPNNSTTFQRVKDVYNIEFDTVGRLHTTDNFYCFRLEAYDPCTNTTSASATICTPRFDVEPINNAVNASWSTGPLPVAGYSLTRQADDGSSFTFPNVAGGSFQDTDVACGTEYCYQLLTTWPGGGQSLSAERCVMGFSTDTPTEITDITTVVTDNAVTLHWDTDPAFVPDQFSIEKSVTQSGFTPLAQTTTNFWTDETYHPEELACYRMSYTDVCGNESPVSREACPIHLTGQLGNDNSIALTWTPYDGWADGVASYTLEKYSADGTLLQTFDTGTESAFVDDSVLPEHQEFVYQVRAHPVASDLDASTSNRVPFLKAPNLFYPTAFTPNGDNLNDVFHVFGQYIDEFELMIFNRWGELLYTTTDMQAGWDGTFKGKDMPEGTYTFIARITDRAGRTYKRSGSVVLLRKSP